MFKLKICAVVCLLGLMCACSGERPEQSLWQAMPVETESSAVVRPVKAAMLLPLTGQAAETGLAFQQAGMMALFERPNSPLELLFFDTKGTADGTRQAWDEAKAVRPDIVIGPVFATEVKALQEESPAVPVISFTSDDSLMSSDTFTMGVLIPDQVTRIVRYACEAGQRRLAVLGPENKTGELAMNALAKAVERCPGMEMKRVSLYDPQTVNFDPAVLKIVPEPIDPKKKNLTPEEEVLLATPMAERVDFDALFIFEDGVKLTQVVSLLSFYDVTPEVVPFYGLTTWQSVKDRNLRGGYYPGTENQRARKFTIRYHRLFGQNPPRISSLAYDAVSLTAVLAERRALTVANLTTDAGYNGVDGRFRLKSDGTNERLLAVYQIGGGSRRDVVSPASADFLNPDEPFVIEMPVAEPDVVPFFPIEGAVVPVGMY